MKGVIFNLLEEAIVAEHGVAAWVDIMDLAGARGTYSSLGSYPDEELYAIVDHAAAGLALPVPDVLRWFGQGAIPRLAERYPTLFANHRGSRSFITSVNDVIHLEVRKLYAGAACPHFHFYDLADGRLAMAYQSRRQLCHLAHGFVLGTAAFFGDAIDVEHLACTSKGDALCRLALDWQ
ncbi:heme NO-binding domain-containing protein [Novosphingobium olei]|uniref:Heme NO-binding protein n=1 Tax=Novosphingobium olei TaxID=2728851 RepID=A0A7Y0BP81_9SPHN|nr:heme NO-binding domain-containing protein [Novosphingobium olei]NML94076.1 heme NO-binding protein [Novosphingobium olei]